MTRFEAKTLKSLIQGLKKIEGRTQYDDGKEILTEEGIETLLFVIDSMEDKT